MTLFSNTGKPPREPVPVYRVEDRKDGYYVVDVANFTLEIGPLSHQQAAIKARELADVVHEEQLSYQRAHWHRRYGRRKRKLLGDSKWF